MELAALDLGGGGGVAILFAVAHSIDVLIFILVGNKDIYKSMDEFEFRSDPITDYGVSCP